LRSICNKVRPIVVRFKGKQAVQAIKAHLKCFRTSLYNVTEQLPPEIMEWIVSLSLRCLRSGKAEKSSTGPGQDFHQQPAIRADHRIGSTWSRKDDLVVVYLY
jgi:hypothetical protein